MGFFSADPGRVPPYSELNAKTAPLGFSAEYQLDFDDVERASVSCKCYLVFSVIQWPLRWTHLYSSRQDDINGVNFLTAAVLFPSLSHIAGSCFLYPPLLRSLPCP